MEIKISGVYKTIQGREVLSNVNLQLENDQGGRIYGIQGINGSGKTMLMRILCGLVLPSVGKVTIDGKVIGKDLSFPSSIGILLENPVFLDEFTGLKNLKLLAKIQSKVNVQQIESTMTAVGLNKNDSRTFRKYSLGMKQRLGIASAIMEDPELIILDEPFNALDADGVKLVQNILWDLKAKGKLIILACHDHTELRALSDQIIELEDGEVRAIRQKGDFSDEDKISF